MHVTGFCFAMLQTVGGAPCPVGAQMQRGMTVTSHTDGLGLGRVRVLSGRALLPSGRAVSCF